MTTDPLYIGIDFGTSGCRACAIDTNAVLQAGVAVPLPEPVAQRQDPAIWWSALDDCLERLLAQVSRERVAAIAVDGTSATLLLCDAGGSPLGPALMYNHAAATDAAARVARVAPADCAAHGPSASLAKLLYLQSLPTSRTARFALHQADWISGRRGAR